MRVVRLSAGEAVGLAGLAGSGRSALLDALFGLAPRRGGSVALDGVSLPPRSPRAAIRRGAAYVTADRRESGRLSELSVRDNLVLAATSQAARFARRRPATEQRRASELVSRLAIDAPSGRVRAATLSGGNHQKVVLGKWLATSPRLLLLDEPTCGVTEELRDLCDRVLVMVRGRVVADLLGARDVGRDHRPLRGGTRFVSVASRRLAETRFLGVLLLVAGADAVLLAHRGALLHRATWRPC